MVDSSIHSATGGSSRKVEIGNPGDLIFLAELFAARTPENCDSKGCRYRSAWCFAGSHAQVYSGVFSSRDESGRKQEKLTRASD